MKIICCQNIRHDDDGHEVSCDRFEVGIPDVLLTLLKSMQGQPDSRLIVRCPGCKKGARFAEVLYEGGKLIYRTIEEPPSLSDKVQFDQVYVTAEV